MGFIHDFKGVSLVSGEFSKLNLKIGFKQVKKALSDDLVLKVYLAYDCDLKIKNPVENLCNEQNVPVFSVDTMEELGKMCGIDVKTSCAAIIK